MSALQIFVKRLLLWMWMSGFTAGMSGSAGPAPRAALPADESGLHDKALIVMVKSKGGACLDHVQVKYLGDRKFLVGQIIDIPGYAGAGRTVWIALDEVAQVIEHDDAEQLKETVRQWYGSPVAQARSMPPPPSDDSKEHYYPGTSSPAAPPPCYSSPTAPPPPGTPSPPPPTATGEH